MSVVIILAAGFGTRMKSETPKVMHSLAGRPLIEWSIVAATPLCAEKPVVVVGHGREQVTSLLGERARYALQEEQLGTGHAVHQAIPLLQETQEDSVIVIYGDMPLIRSETLLGLNQLFQSSRESCGAVMALLTVTRDEPQGFGRIVRDEKGDIQAIVEEVDCTEEQKQIRELNPGVYCFDTAWLRNNLPNLTLSPKGEYYLTDMLGMAVEQGYHVPSMPVADVEVSGINTRVHLAEAEKIMRMRILERHMLAGVTVTDPSSTYIDVMVEIGNDTTILPGCILQGNTTIGNGCIIGPHSYIADSSIGARCKVTHSVVEQAAMAEECEIGPFGHLRKGANLDAGVHMGNFGEVKNSYLGPGTKMGHFSYIGDAHVEANVNIGAGTITCNYDGTNKHPTRIGEGAFLGSDTMLVAPVTIGAGASTGAGAVVTKDIEEGGHVRGVPAKPPEDSRQTTKQKE